MTCESKEKESRELGFFRYLHKLHHNGVQLEDSITELMLRLLLVVDAVEEGVYEKADIYFSGMGWAITLMKLNPDLEPEIIYPKAMRLAWRTQQAFKQGLWAQYYETFYYHRKTQSWENKPEASK